MPPKEEEEEPGFFGRLFGAKKKPEEAAAAAAIPAIGGGEVGGGDPNNRPAVEVAKSAGWCGSKEMDSESAEALRNTPLAPSRWAEIHAYCVVGRYWGLMQGPGRGS